MINPKLRFITIVFSLLLSLIFIPARAYADELSLGIYPPITQISATPPSAITSKLTIQNINDRPASLDIQFIPFVPSDSANGELSFTANVPADSPYAVLFERIGIYDRDLKIQKLNLEPFETKTLTLIINLEKGDSRGDYYFSVVFISQDSGGKAGSTASLPAGIASNVLLSIGPLGKTAGAIERFSAPSFLDKGPVPFSLRLKNSSDHYITPTGTITISNMFGQQVSKLEIAPQAILAASKRYMIDSNQASPSAALSYFLEQQKMKNRTLTPSVIWQDSFLFGFYTGKAVIKLSDTGPLLTATTHFIALPYTFLLGLILALTIILGIYLRVKRVL